MIRRFGMVIASAVLSLALLAPAIAQSLGSFIEPFDAGTPAVPTPYQNPHNWQIYTNGFDRRQVGTDAMRAQHGPNCEPPGFPYNSTNSHPLRTAADVVFVCNDHLMTAPGLSGYSAVYMTPPAVLDWSASADAVLRFNMSTLRTASRDWVDVVLTPWSQHNLRAFNQTDQHIPPDNIHIELGGVNTWVLTQRAGGSNRYGQGTRNVSIPSDLGLSWDQFLQQSASRRDTFELRLSRSVSGGAIDRISLCMPGYQRAQGGIQCWASNSPLPFPLDPAVWGNQATVQINDRVYNPEKSCADAALANGYVDGQQPGVPNGIYDQYYIAHNAYGDLHCPPNTWHWSDVRLTPATPFQIINTTPANVTITSTSVVRFAQPAPAGAVLEFAYGGNLAALAISYDGVNFRAPRIQTYGSGEDGGYTVSDPIPAGAQQVTVRGGPGFWGGWAAEGFTVLGRPGGSLPPAPPTNTPAPTATLLPATATPIAATSTPIPTPTLVEATATTAPTLAATATAMPSASATAVATATQAATATTVPTSTSTATVPPTAQPTATPDIPHGCTVRLQVNDDKPIVLPCMQ